MEEKFDIQQYLADGVEQVVKDALKATLKDPRESAFLAKFALASAKANKKREEEKVISIEAKLKEFKVCPLCHHSLED